jgi:aminopeptidase N
MLLSAHMPVVTNEGDAMASLLNRAPGQIAGALIALLFVATSARAEQPFDFAATPGKLPKTVVPIHYALDLKPDLEKLTLAGSELVDIDVKTPTDRLVLNAVNMTVETAAIEGDAGQTATISADTAAETVTFVFPRPIAAGRHKLRVAFSAHVNKFGRGLFMVDYPTSEGRKRMISSHLEPSDARRIFPSWDEPVFKASFELAVTLPEKFLAVSNMPVARETPAGEGLKRVSFESTPKMSSYLFVLTAGELERLTGDADGVTIGVVAAKGKSGNGRYALDEAIGLLKYFNDYFGVKYPLPKLDLIAVPGGFGGAMENWGGITFFESRLLFDPATSPQDARRGIFSILSHEMAHQWFGDLVTNAWWDNIWLNEGFASWMQAKSAEALHPDWQTWLNSNGAKQAAMAEDARRTTRPIQRPIANETEAMAAFDVITYSKGQAFIRMLEGYLGDDVFRTGIRAYMRQHAYSSTTTADLWRALETASGKPVGNIAAAYTEQAGVPLVTAEAKCVGEQQRVVLRQERFTVRDPDAKAQRWQVPITVGTFGATRPADTVLLDGTAEIAAGRCGEPVKLNFGDAGYYRVQYDAAMQAALAKSMAAMAPADQVNLIADSWALAEAGRGGATDFFALIDNISEDTSRAVWDQVIRTLSRIDHLERGRPGRAAFWAYARAKLKPVFDRVGWDRRAEEPAERALLRNRLIWTLGDFGDEAVINEAKRKFAAFLRDPNSLPADLRDPVTHLVGRGADRAMYDTLLGLARKTTQTDERVRYYNAAASATNPEFAKETLAITLTDEVTASMVAGLIFSVAGSGEHPELAVDFVRANFSALIARQGPGFRNTVFANLMTNFTDPARAAELAAFAPAHETSGGRIVSARAQERILADADFAARALPAIDDWIRRQTGRQ